MCAVPFDGISKESLSNKQLVMIQQLIKRRTHRWHLICYLPLRLHQSERHRGTVFDFMVTGRDAHKSSLQGTEQTLDEISNKTAPSKYLEEVMSAPNIAKQLGTLGGGKHFLEVSCSRLCEKVPFCVGVEHSHMCTS